ncbi:tripartite ATP-independent transporter DctM subunit [Neobacillus niacini]|uniref:TRAP transporter large permease n=1 Tax=Neobacillus niacini TaxID=86668 RepID=UPI0027824E3B|nr:TRAP transporter large permease subunit [Neobacillus niacini]MDQ1002181.1 tripartite ATP-independent transporter DctM subunit [Neobacillus niacini]
MDIGLISLIIFGSLILFLGIGVPVGFTMGGISLILGFIFWDGLPSIDGFVLGSFSEFTKSTLTALPLYIFMAAILMYSDLADDMYECIYRWFGGLRGGLAAGTVIISSIFAAMVGISSVATATLGLIARPSMLKRGYDDKLTIGVIMAGGTLGLLIPPSIVAIVYASESGESTGALFMAGVVPGILAAILFIIYALVLCFIKPEMGPAISSDQRFTFKEKLISLKSIALPMLVIIVVLGSIYFGITTPTEAGAVGVVGALVAAAAKRKLTFSNIKNMFLMSTKLFSLVFWIVIGAVAYARIVSVTGIGQSIANYITGVDINRWLILLIIMAVFLALGMVMDTIAVLLITAPLILPLLTSLEFDLVWFGILFTIAVCIGGLSPPFGMSIFIMKGVAPDISLQKIYSAVWPFIFLFLLCIALVMIFPELALWLPNYMNG